MHSFYLSPDAWQQATPQSLCYLDDTETHHLAKVLRMKQGEQVLIFDGFGRQALCSIESIEKKRCTLKILEISLIPQPANKTILAVAWCKAARRGWLMEKAVEFEASAIWLWQADRSQFPLPKDIKESWKGQLVAGAKQCKNLWLPELYVMPNGAGEVIEKAQSIKKKFILYEDEHNSMLTYEKLTDQPTDTALYVIGPEGGFSPAEVAQFKESMECVSLGKRILRYETAALFCLGLQWWAKELHITQ